MIRTSHHTPVYRDVLKRALQTAWQDRQFWPLALLAGILVTAGSYDVLLQALTSITSQGQFTALTTGTTFVAAIADAGTGGLDRVLSVIGGLEMLALVAIVVILVAVLSCVAQGGLVYALGARKRGAKATLGESFRVGAHAVWPIVALNALTFAFLWILRFLVALPLFLALDNTSTVTYLIYLASFIVFIPLSFLIAILQIFALNGMIVQGATLADGLRRGYMLLKQHWVVVIETALLQILLSLAVWAVFLLAFLFLMVPIFVFVATSVMVQSVSLFTASMILGAVVFTMGLLVAAAFTIQLQYATWTYLYRRLGEGGVVPKIHRLVRNVTGFFSVPQS